MPVGQLLQPTLWWLMPVKLLLMSRGAMAALDFDCVTASFTSSRLIATASYCKLRFGAGVQVPVCSLVLMPSRRLEVCRCQPQMCPA